MWFWIAVIVAIILISVGLYKAFAPSKSSPRSGGSVNTGSGSDRPYKT